MSGYEDDDSVNAVIRKIIATIATIIFSIGIIHIPKHRIAIITASPVDKIGLSSFTK